MTPFDHKPLVEAAEAAEMQEAIRMQADVSEDGVPRGWIGPVEGLRRQRAIRQLRAHTDAQAARIKELEEALRPFADAAIDLYEPSDRDNADIWEHPAAGNITCGHLRNAVATIERAPALEPRS